MDRKDTGWLLVALLLVGVAACSERPTGPEDADLAPVAAFGKPAGEKPGKPSSDIPLTVVFTDEGNGIRSDSVRFGEEWPDAWYIYVDGEDFVWAKIKSSGQFYFQAFSGKETGKKRDPVLRGVTVDLTEQVGDAMNQTYLDEFIATVGGFCFTSDVTLHTRDNDGVLPAMKEGDFFVDGGKIAFNDYGDGDAWEWRLLFDTRVDGVADGVGLCVRREADYWTVTAEDGACGGLVDGDTELWRVQGGVFTPVARFHTPMHLTLTRN